MSRYGHLIGIAALAFILGPQAARADQGDQMQGNNTVPILGFFSGFNSCPSKTSLHESNMGIAARRLANRIQRETYSDKVEYVISCFPKSRSQLQFITSYDGGDVRYRGDEDVIVDEIVTLAKRSPNHRVYLAGHSYGGWLAMYVASALPSWVRVELLMTLDPISARNCSPSVFVSSYMGSTWRLKPAVGCTQAPADLSSNKINSRIGKWLNFYQDTFPLLHSGYIPIADQNDLLEFQTTYLLEYKAHVMMEEDARPWIAFNRETVFSLQ